MYAKKNGRRAATLIAQTRDVLLRATAEHAADLYEHMLEVGELSRDVARRLGLDAEMLDLTLRTGELHDVGKVAIPTSVLRKAGPLNDDEWALIRTHTVIGAAHPQRRAGATNSRDVRTVHSRVLRRHRIPRRTRRRGDPAAFEDRVRL